MATNFDLFLSPTLAAFTGWFVINYIPGPLTLRAGCAFVLVLLELRITASAVLPSISAAILPLVAGEASLYYPVAVAAFTAAIALVCYILDWTGHGNYTKVRLKYHFLPQRRQLPALLFRWGRVLAITLACAWLSEYTGRTYLLAPPLIIACIEFVNPGGPFRKRPFSLYLLVVLGGAAGAGAAWLLPGLGSPLCGGRSDRVLRLPALPDPEHALPPGCGPFCPAFHCSAGHSPGLLR